MTDDVQINPCRASLKFLKANNKACQYNNVNDTCYKVCYDWYGPGSNVRGTKCYKDCTKCVLPYLKRDTCYFKPRPPAVFNDVPAWFPVMYNKTGGDVEKSISSCYQLCKQGAKNVEECQARCNLDMMALEDDDHNPKPPQPKSVASPPTAKKSYITPGLAVGIPVSLFIAIVLVVLIFYLN